MFVASYFAPRYFTGSYWTKLGLQVEVPVEPPVAVGPPRPPRPAPFEQIDARAKGQILVIRWSLLPGQASGSATAPGDSVAVVNAVARGTELGRQQWQMMDGAARSRIVLTDEEEIMLILADAA